MTTTPDSWITRYDETRAAYMAAVTAALPLDVDTDVYEARDDAMVALADEARGLIGAVAAFVDMWATSQPEGDVATAFGCGEVEALAGVFRAAGRADIADNWIEYHADADDEGDMHHPDYVAED